MPAEKPITVSPKKVLDKKPMATKASNRDNTDTKIQKTLLVVDNIRLQTINTLEALQDLSREDSVRLADLNRSMRELVSVSNDILDSNTKAPDGEASNFIRALSETNKLLSKFKDTQIKGMSLEKFLEKQEVEHDRQVLRDKEISKIISDASHNLGQPFAEFLEQNISRISTTPVTGSAVDTGIAAIGGPLAPLLSLITKSIPEALQEYRGLKDSFKNIKERVFGKKDEVTKLSKGVDVNKALDIQDSKTIPIAPAIINDGDEPSVSSVQDREKVEFHEKVVDKLDKIDKVLENKLEDVEKATKNASGGGVAGGAISAMGNGLMGLLKNPKMLALLATGGVAAGVASSAATTNVYKKGQEALGLKGPSEDLPKLKSYLGREMDVLKDAFKQAKEGVFGSSDEKDSGPEFTPMTPGKLIQSYGYEESKESIDNKAFNKIIDIDSNKDSTMAVPKGSLDLKPQPALTPHVNHKLESGKLRTDQDKPAATVNQAPQEVKKIEPLRLPKVMSSEEIQKSILDALKNLKPQASNGNTPDPPKLLDLIPNMPQDPITQLINSGTL